MRALNKKYQIKKEGKVLKKAIGLAEAIAMVVGIVIGSGIFFKASAVFKSAGSPILGILAWVVAGVIAMASALTVAEIATAIPKTGGIFIYLKELYGERWAFLFGWVKTIVQIPGVAAALSIVFVTQSTYFIPMTNVQQKILAICILFFITFMNIISTKLGSKIQLIATIGKLIPIAVIIVFGLISGKAHSFSVPVNASSGTIGFTGFAAAILASLWAYDGWVAVTNIGGELKNPKKDLSKSIVIGMLTIMAAYILINVAMLNVMPVSDIIASKKAASDAAIILFGNGGAGFIAAGILVSIFGALNGYLLTSARIPFAMAQDNLLPFPKFFGKVNDKFQTPVNSLVFEAILACLYILTGSFDTLTSLAVFVVWIFFVITVAGIFILRNKHKELERPYKVPFYPIVPIIGIIGGTYIIISTLLTGSLNAIYGVAITLIGLPVYYYINKRNQLKYKEQ